MNWFQRLLQYLFRTADEKKEWDAFIDEFVNNWHEAALDGDEE